MNPSTTINRCLQKARGASQGDLHRPAFTLTEMLVVVAIIASLLALLVPTLQGAIRSARNAAIKSEIDMLHMALMNYKSEYGSLPPCFDPAPNQGSLAGQHIKRLFPRSNVLTEFTELQTRGLLQPVLPNNSLTTWLSGYTTNPRLPLTGGARQPLYDFDKSRITGGTYHPTGKPESPYIYINSSQYGINPAGYSAEINPVDGLPFNADTFQIISAGRDGIYPSDDDVSNFWPATRKEYADRVNQ